MRTKVKYTGIIVITLVLLACFASFVFRKQIAAHFIPEVAQIDVIHIKLRNDTSYINFKLTATNKSFLHIKIDTIKYKISLFNKTYLERQRFVGVELPSHGSDTIQVALKIPYVSILKDLALEKNKGDSTSYSIQIYLQCITLFGKTEISINRAAKLKIPQVPELEIVKIDWKKVRLKSILAAITIKLINYSSITLAIKDLRYTMIILEHGNLKGTYQEPIIIKPNGATLVTFPIDILVHNIGKTVFEVIVNKDQYDYTLTLNAILESTDSVKNKVHIELTKNGKLELKK